MTPNYRSDIDSWLDHGIRGISTANALAVFLFVPTGAATNARPREIFDLQYQLVGSASNFDQFAGRNASSLESKIGRE